MTYTVGDVAKMAHVSVRTLHHYDELGLLAPSARTDAGYRLYTDGDLKRLQQVLFYRELGMPLDEIRRVMLDPSFDSREALLAQRDALLERVLQTEAMLQAVEKALQAEEEGKAMDKEEMFEVFGDFNPKDYEDEVKERWGDTDAYKESARRVKKYTKADWEQIKAEGEQIYTEVAELMDAEVPATDQRAMDAVDKHRLHIDKWFYACSHEMQVCLGEMYVQDPRFKATYEKIRPGMAQYVCDAIKANAERAAG